MTDRETLAKRLNEAGLLEDRFIPVKNGEKGSVTDHTDPSNRHSSFADLSGNYGVYAGPNPDSDRWLIDVDVDDYSDDANSEALEAYRDLPDTFGTVTPHTDGDSGGHDFYVIDGENVAEKINQAVGANNPSPSWGDIQVHNKYVVGPGSQLDGCGKEWCDDCATPDGGRYAIANDAPIAEIELADLLDVLEADGYGTDGGVTDYETTDDGGGESGFKPSASRGYADALEVALDDARIRDYLTDGAKAAGFTDGGSPDRSKADWYVACKMVEEYVPKEQAKRLLENGFGDDSKPNTKVRERGSDYWDTTWANAHEHVRNSDGEDTAKAATDGGAAAISPDRDGGPDIDGPADGDSPPTPDELKATLGYDDEDDSLRDIPKHELANGIETMLAERENVHIRLLDNEDSKDQPIYAMDEETKVWENKGARRLAQKARRILGSVYRNGVQSELENALRSNVDGHWLLDRDELGVEVGYLPVKNRVLDLDTRDSREAKPEDYLLGRLPTEYDPEATIDGTRFEEFLLQCVKPHDREKLQEYAGYTLLKNAQPYKKALFLVGPQNSGKGTFLKTLEMILGEDNVASETLYNLVNTRWGTHSIYGRMVNISNEVSPSGLGNVGQFKMLTGGEDKVPAEDKGVSKYRFTVTQKFLFATNEFPEVEDAGEPFYSRLLFVEFPNSIPDEKQDEGLRDDLREERSAILNWMLEGLDRLRESGTFSGERPIEEKKELTKAFGSTIEQFAHNALEATNDSEHVIHKKELYNAFIRYCDFLNADTPTQTKFTRRLKEEDGITDGKSTRVDGDANRPDVFKGAKLNEEFFKKIQAGLPSHSYETNSGGQTGMDSYGE